MCDPYYVGAACETRTKCVSGCSQHGSCDDDGRCKCDAGWSGPECEHKTCVSSVPGAAPCLGRGRCINGTCECDTGANGTAACEMGERCMHGCNGHGVCERRPGSAEVCRCETGWFGSFCQHQACTVAGGCGAHGWCDYASGTCKCDAGWEGEGCELQKCLLGCSGHGTCIQPVGGEAEIRREKVGDIVEAAREFSLAHGGGGPTGLMGGELAYCRCNRGWVGVDCSVIDPDQTAELYMPAAPPPPATPSTWYDQAKRHAPRKAFRSD